MNKTIEQIYIFVHGMSGSKEDHWYPWLEQQLSKRGHKVINKTFPNNLMTERENSIRFAYELIDIYENRKINFVTHSSGCAIAFRIAEQKKLNNLYIIGGLVEDLGYQEEKQTKLFTGGFQFERIICNTNKIIQIDSDNDPYIRNKHFQLMANKLHSMHVKLSERRHFGDPEDSPKEFPELLELIISSSYK
jgi:hypothetical protein